MAIAAASTVGRDPSPGAVTPSPRLVVAVLSSVGLVASLCMTLVVPLVPRLPELLHTTTATASWVITSTLLAGAVATPIAGRLGDMVGKRRVLLISLALLVAGSVLCATTSSLLPVLVGRALQGVAVSAVPLGISLMRDALPPERLGSGIALMSATLGIGGGLGLPLSALIVQVADWHALFWTAGVLGLAGLLLVRAIIPETPTRSGGGFDAVGAVGLSVGLVCLLLAVSKGGEWGWGSSTTLGCLAAAVLILLAWGRYELRATDPLVDLRLNARRAVLVPNLISIPVGVAMFTGMVVLPPAALGPDGLGPRSGPVAAGRGSGPRPQRPRHDGDVPGHRPHLVGLRPAHVAADRARRDRRGLRRGHPADVRGLADLGGHRRGRGRRRARLRLAPRADHARRPDHPDRRGQRAEHAHALDRHLHRLGGRRGGPLRLRRPGRAHGGPLARRPARHAPHRGRLRGRRPRREPRRPGAGRVRGRTWSP